MASRRSKQGESALLVLIAIIATPIYLANKTIETLGWPIIATMALFIVGCWIAYRVIRAAIRKAAQERRYAALLSKYGDAEIVDRIMQRVIWETQTAEQLRDALGEPVTTDQKLTKTKRTERWMYNQTGANRFGLRVTLENGVVVGWEQKG